MADDRKGNETERGEDSFPPLIDDAIVLTGPTAAGKTSVAIALADRIGGELISLDSIAVYQGMDIGTAKPSDSDRQRVPHHLIDLVDPTEDFSVVCYLREAHAKVQEIRQRGHAAIFVGGTPMFLKGVLRGFDPGPPADWTFRDAVEADIEMHGVDALRQRLRQVDPLAEHRIGANDTRRMIRALEVARQTGTPISHRQVQFDRAREASTCNVFSLAWPRDQLHHRINQRVEEMFRLGLIDEIRRLLTKYGNLSRTASQAVGYREVLQWLGSDSSMETLVDEVAAHTRQLARRQETWLRSLSEIRPLSVQTPLEPEQTAEQIHQLLTAMPTRSN
jgi:tRNA dimethylallyltransferase